MILRIFLISASLKLVDSFEQDSEKIIGVFLQKIRFSCPILDKVEKMVLKSLRIAQAFTDFTIILVDEFDYE